MNTNDYHCCIVGGGVSGLYCAFRLQQKCPNARILIIEKLARLGGRVMSSVHGKFVLEYGPMRYEPALQPRFAELLKELGIATKDFPPYTCPHVAPDMNTLTYAEIGAIHHYKDLPPAFALLKYGLKRVLEDQWNVDKDDIHDPFRDARKAWLKRDGMFQGRYLHSHGLWDTLAHVLSKEALDFLLHKGTFYHMLELNPNAADQICFLLDILATANDHLITIDEKDGSYTLIQKLHKSLNLSKCDMRMSTTVSGFEEDPEDHKVRVTLSNGEVVQCNHLIFTCQKKAYDKIQGFNEDIRRCLDCVMVVKLFKIFVIFENPPFEAQSVPQPNFQADKVPCREIHYGYDSRSKRGMLMLYGDLPHLNYWKAFNTRVSEHPKGDHNPHLVNHLMHYLRKIFPNHTAPMHIVHYSMMDWSCEPYMSGVHLWKPGYVSEDIMNHLACFGKDRNIHVCGETYSNYQGFIEGGLRTVDNVINAVLKLD